MAASEPNEIAGLRASVDRLASRIELLEGRIRDEQAVTEERTDALADALRIVHDDDVGNRARVRELRESAGYEAAFSEEAPLVSVVIATWTDADGVLERSVPSALAQTHPNIEVIVVGDASPPEVVERIAALDDPRVRFENLTIRGPYDANPHRAWMSAGTPGFNAAIAEARGRWIAPLGDDDSFDPDHVERLLARAREGRFEYVGSRLRVHTPDGAVSELGAFPPAHGSVGVQAAIYHSGLRFLEFELAHALLDVPNDWGLIHRMMRVGVRFGYVDAATVNYRPSGGGARAEAGQRTRWSRPQPERAGSLEETLAARVEELEAQLGEALEQSAALASDRAALDTRYRGVVESRAWRVAAALRRLSGRS